MWHVRFLSRVAGAAFIQATVLSPALHAQSGTTRDLRCRGKPGIDIRVHQDPSPRTSSLVTMVLRYERPRETRTLEQGSMGSLNYGVSLQLIPGSCTWRYDGVTNIPLEPGVVYFDIDRDAQAWKAPSARDTTIDVAMNFPDVVSLTRYLSDSTRYWGFYVDDVTNLSISYGARGRPAPPIAFGDGVRDTAAGATIRSGATTNRPATGRGSTTVRAPTATDKMNSTGRGSGPVSTASPVRNDPPLPGARPSGNATAATATVVRAPIQLQGVSTVLGGFTIRFSARANASPIVRYSTEKPIRQSGDWVFPGGRPATGPEAVGGGLTGKPVLLPGSPAVPAGTEAEVVRRSADTFRAQYTATSRPGTVGRGTVYHYIITVPATTDFSQEQFVGQLTTVSQTVRMAITSFTILKTSIYARDLTYDFVAWTAGASGGPWDGCQNATCENTGDYLRLLVFATPPQTSGSVFTTPGWNTPASVIMGIARREFDLRTIPDDRPLRAFTLRSPAGDIEFEVQGTLEVVRR